MVACNDENLRCTPQKLRKPKIEPAEIWQRPAHDSGKWWRYCGEARTGGLRRRECAAGGRRRVRRQQAAGPAHGRVRNGCAQWPACVRWSIRSSCSGHRRWARSYGQRSTTGCSSFSIRLTNYCRDTRCCPCFMASLYYSLRTTCSTDCALSPICATCMACSCSEVATRLIQWACTHSTSNSPHFSRPSWRSLRRSLLRCSISPLASSRCRARATSARERCVSPSVRSASTPRAAHNGCISRTGWSPTAGFSCRCALSCEHRVLLSIRITELLFFRSCFALSSSLLKLRFLRWRSKAT